jgi:hypothetical protein
VEFCEGIEWIHLSFLKWNPIHQQEWIKWIFFPNEDAQLCHSFLHVSQDLIANNGKKTMHCGIRSLNITIKIVQLDYVRDLRGHCNQNGALENMMLLNSLLIIVLSKLYQNLKY